jgi:prolyl 4-hydroxylase
MRVLFITFILVTLMVGTIRIIVCSLKTTVVECPQETTKNEFLQSYEERTEMTTNEFLQRYEERTGEEWKSSIPRHAPSYTYWSVPDIGHEHKVSVSGQARKWLSSTVQASSETIHIRVLSIRPRVFVVDNFLSDFECDHLVAYHRPLMKPSEILGPSQTPHVDKKFRDSSSSRMGRDDDQITESIFQRLALAFNLPEELMTDKKCSEPINILHYGPSGQFLPHYDVVKDETSSRFLSALLYFNTLENGGGTSFPKAKLTVNAVKGRLMFFYDLLPDGNLDVYSLHSGDPVTVGEKWAAAAWLWDPFYQRSASEEEESYRTSKVPSLFDRVTGKPL